MFSIVCLKNGNQIYVSDLVRFSKKQYGKCCKIQRVENNVYCEHKKNTFGKAKCGFSNDTRGIVTGKYPQLASRIKALGDLYLCLT